MTHSRLGNLLLHDETQSQQTRYAVIGTIEGVRDDLLEVVVLTNFPCFIRHLKGRFFRSFFLSDSCLQPLSGALRYRIA